MSFCVSAHSAVNSVVNAPKHSIVVNIRLLSVVKG